MNVVRAGAAKLGAFVEWIPKPATQKGLLVATVGCALFTTIYPVRFIGALALRSVALLSSGINGADAWKHATPNERLALIAKIACVALGLVGLIATSPLLITTSLVGDLALQVFEIVKALDRGEGKQALFHLGAASINVVVLLGLYTGSFPLLVTAAAINGLMMGWLMFKTEDLEAVCYLSLAAIGGINAATIPPRLMRFEMGTAPKPNLPLVNLPYGGTKIVTRELR